MPIVFWVRLSTHVHSLAIAQFMVQLATHLAIHLGQIDYHRRILTGEKGEAGIRCSRTSREP